MATVPALSDYEYQFGDNGTLLNASDAGVAATLPFVDITLVKGLDSTDYRTSTHDHEGVDGGYVDSEFLTTRTVVLSGTMFVDGDDPETYCDALKYDFRPMKDSQPLYFKHPGKPVRVVLGKGQGARYDVTQLRRTGQTEIEMTVVCPDPYIYDANQVITSGIVASSSSGFGFNMSFNLSFGGSIATSGGATVFNGGNHRAYPIITIYGPVATPVLTDSATGRVISFDLTLSKSDILVIDTRKHTAVLNGSISLRSTLISGSKWFWLDSGYSTITFTGDLSTITGTATGTGTSTTPNYLHVTDADAADIAVGDQCWLQNSSGALKESYLVSVTSLVSAAGSTDIFFTPPASAVTVSGDRLVAGIPTFDVSVYSTWY